MIGLLAIGELRLHSGLYRIYIYVDIPWTSLWDQHLGVERADKR